jgi:hypothetical protein
MMISLLVRGKAQVPGYAVLFRFDAACGLPRREEPVRDPQIELLAAFEKEPIHRELGLQAEVPVGSLAIEDRRP